MYKVQDNIFILKHGHLLGMGRETEIDEEPRRQRYAIQRFAGRRKRAHAVAVAAFCCCVGIDSVDGVEGVCGCCCCCCVVLDCDGDGLGSIKPICFVLRC